MAVIAEKYKGLASAQITSMECIILAQDKLQCQKHGDNII